MEDCLLQPRGDGRYCLTSARNTPALASYLYPQRTIVVLEYLMPFRVVLSHRREQWSHLAPDPVRKLGDPEQGNVSIRVTKYLHH